MATDHSISPNGDQRKRRKKQRGRGKVADNSRRRKCGQPRGNQRASGQGQKTSSPGVIPDPTSPNPEGSGTPATAGTNTFEHFFSPSKRGPVGAHGSHGETAIRDKDVVRVGGLAYDIDIKHFTAEFAKRIRDYLVAVLPELELRQTSQSGNLHAIVHFKQPIAPNTARRIWDLLPKLLLSDPSATFLMKARVVGSKKLKSSGDTYVVRRVRTGSPVAAKALLSRLAGVPVGDNGDRSGPVGWKREQFRGVMTVSVAPNGQRLWDGNARHGICPLHGTGANAEQCAMHPDRANCTCFGDCRDATGRPKTIELAEIVAKRVVAEGFWDKYKDYYDREPETIDGRPVVTHKKQRPLMEFYRGIIGRFQATGRHFLYGNTPCEISGVNLTPLSNPDSFVGAVVSLMEIAVRAKGGLVYKRFAKEDAAAILNANAVLNQLLAISLFTEIPVFDDDLRLVEPGHNKASQIYYSGNPIKPSGHLRVLPDFLDVVSFRDRASRDNYVAWLLTNLFPTHFCGLKPAAIFDANRPQVGKTMLGTCAAAVSTVQPITTVTYTPNDEEFEKKLASKVLVANYILIDNAKTKKSCEIASAVLERSITDQQLSYRQLGFNKLIERPNSILWMLSMNNARLSPDLTDRGLPIRLHYAGEPTKRESPIGDPKDFFLKHRLEIVAELLGMVTRWIAAGCPEAKHAFRFRKWARRMGGILAVNGFNDFLLNLQESRVEFDPILSALRTLAERYLDQLKKAAEWLRLLKPDGLLANVWTKVPSERAQASELGKLFKVYLSQTFQINLDDGRCVTARLTSQSGHAGLVWGFVTDDGGIGSGGTAGGGPGEDGERHIGRSPRRSPTQASVGERVVTAGERGERKTESNGKSTSPSPECDSPLQSTKCEEDTGRRSPSPPKPAVSPCSDKSIEAVDAPVNAAASVPHVHHGGASSGPSGAPAPRPAGRESLLRQLHERHPAPKSSTVGDKATSQVAGMGTTQLGGEKIVYEIGWDGCPFQSGILAFDTETTAIEDDASVPELVIATASDGKRHVILADDEVAAFLLAHRAYVIVFHNVAFDFWVLDQRLTADGREDARQALRAMAGDNRLRDTMLLDMLLRLGRDGDGSAPRDLGTVASEHANLDLDKDDPFRTRYAEIRGQPLTKVKRRFLSYAIKDAVATIRAYAALFRAAEGLMQQHVELYDSQFAARYGVLTEAIQVQGAIALAAVSRNGMHVDTERIRTLRGVLERRRDDLLGMVEEVLSGDNELAALGIAEDGLFKRTKDGRPDFSQSGAIRILKKTLLEVLEHVAATIEKRRGESIDIPQTPRSNAISTKEEHWSRYRNDHPFVDRWLSLNGVQKLLQFANTYADCRAVHPRYNVLMRTGRTSCAKPALQQLPRDGGIRECFIPSPGHLFISIDYASIELRTLATVCESRFGFSKLGDVIRDGVDPHAYTAALIRGVEFDEFRALRHSDPKAFATDRQRAKAINFGVPGGLGARTLVTYADTNYGIQLTDAEAKSLRDTLINKVYPELRAYLEENLMANLARSLGVTEQACWEELSADGERAEWLPLYVKNVTRGRTCRSDDGEPYNQDFLEQTWAGLQRLNTRPEFSCALAAQQGSEGLSGKLFSGRVVATLTGRIRANVTFTQSRNTPFQGLAGDGAKLALFRLVTAGYRVVAFIHDEVVIELPVDADHTSEARRIVEIMCSAMAEVTGDVPIECGETPLTERWSKDAKAVCDDRGRLIVWRPGAKKDDSR